MLFAACIDKLVQVSVFKSGSLQRPSAKSSVPSPDHYHPKIGSIHPVIGNPAAAGMTPNHYVPDPGSVVGVGGERFWSSQFKCQTDPVVGPGTYEGADFERTLLEDCQEHIRRSSALSNAKFGEGVAFQSTMPQRPGFFYNPGQSPDVAPGCYEPLEPRLKDLKASGGDWRQVM